MMTRVSKSNVGVAVCVVALSGLTGCKKLTQMLGEKAAEQVGDLAAGVAGPSEEEQTMGLYAEGFNVLIDDPQDCLTEYFDDVPAEGPQPEAKYRFFPAHTRGTMELGKVKESFQKAAASSPDSLKHLQPLASAALKNLDDACSTFAEVHKYYDAEDFKEDEWKTSGRRARSCMQK